MKNLYDELSRLRRVGLVVAAIALAVFTMLTACGVGVVGTGTGAPVPTAEASLCSAGLGSALACPSANAPAVSSAPVTLTGADAQGRTSVRAEVTGDAILFEEPCRSLRFVGRWSRLSDETEAFAGTWVDATRTQPAAGILRVRPIGDGASLEVWLYGAEGEAIGGPWIVTRSSGGTTPTVACVGS